MTVTITTNPSNTLQKLPLATATASINFTTDGAAASTISFTSTTVNDNKFTVPSNTSMVAGDFYSIEGAGFGGTVPWVNVYNGQLNGSTTVCTCMSPAAVTLVTNATAYKYERIETRYRAKKVTLTDLTSGDVYVWDQTLLDDQAKYTPSGGSTTTLTTRGILNRSNCIGIHPNLLPANHSFTLKCDYDYYS